MSDLFWPGDERAGNLMTDLALLQAMATVEDVWLSSLVTAGVAPSSAACSLQGLVGAPDLDALARGSESGGNPVIELLELLRERVGSTDASRWLHRGLTSQDVLDTAMMLLLRDALAEVGRQLDSQVATLAALAQEHRSTAMVGRTLTQHAVPITFGLKAANWLTGVLDAAERVAAVRSALPIQVGGAAGTNAAVTELARLRGFDDPPATAWRMVAAAAATLGLESRPPWHTNRSPVSTIGDALVGCTDAWGHLAADISTLSRPEIGELAEGSGGGSSTMPGKRNPTLSVLVRRAALAGPPLAATLHHASAMTVDERPDGAWHAEWATLRDLARRTVVAGSQTTDLLADLRVDETRMGATVETLGVPAEQRSMQAIVGGAADSPTVVSSDRKTSYLGTTDLVIDAVLDRARTFGEATP